MGTERPDRTQEETLLHTIQGKFQELGIQADTIDGVDDEVIGEAVLWLHRLLPQQQEVCSRLGTHTWPVLDDIRSAPCARATGHQSDHRDAVVRILSRMGEKKND